MLQSNQFFDWVFRAVATARSPFAEAYGYFIANYTKEGFVGLYALYNSDLRSKTELHNNLSFVGLYAPCNWRDIALAEAGLVRGFAQLCAEPSPLLMFFLFSRD